MTTTLEIIEYLDARLAPEASEPGPEERARELISALINRFAERDISYATDARKLREAGATEIAWGYEAVARAWREAGKVVRDEARRRELI